MRNIDFLCRLQKYWVFDGCIVVVSNATFVHILMGFVNVAIDSVI